MKSIWQNMSKLLYLYIVNIATMTNTIAT